MAKKLFNKIPYEIRDASAEAISIEDAEKAIEKFLNDYQFSLNDIDSVFADNKHNGNILHLRMYSNDIPTDTVWIDDLGLTFEKENIIKKAREIFNVNNEELASMIGYKYSAVNKASSGDISTQMHRALEMLLEIHSLKEELADYDHFKKIVKKASNS